jgi:peptidoglycan hydrolase CwlO-like protein
MAEEIAALNNVRHGLDNQVNDLKSDLKYSQARLGELEKLIVSLQQECSTLQLKLKRRRKPNA